MAAPDRNLIRPVSGATAFYVPTEGGFEATELTRGPWDEGSQHLGPPAALLGRELERAEARPEFEIARVTFEILGPVPIGQVEVSARVTRPGRTIELLEAELSAGARPAVRARAWRIRREKVALDEGSEAVAAPAGPDGTDPMIFALVENRPGWHRAMEFRSLQGGFDEIGPATVWMRMATPLLAGEEPSPLQRVVMAADGGNGISSPLPWDRYLFINTDLTVNLHRQPEGEWVCLDSHTRVEPHGTGLTVTRLFDGTREIGLATQTLVVRER